MCVGRVTANKEFFKDGLKVLSAKVVCCIYIVFANYITDYFQNTDHVDPDQTAPTGAV